MQKDIMPMIKMAQMVCVGCGKTISSREAEGSMKHPYCAGCFERVWHNDYGAYLAWLEETH